MGDSATGYQPLSYAEQDTSPTTNEELRGWFAYGMGAETFAIVGLGSFLPVTLEQLARETGVLWSDRSTPCVQPLQAATLLTRANSTQSDVDQCLIHPFGATITTASFTMYTLSFAVFVQALLMISFSTFADYGSNRKRILLQFGVIGAIAAMSFVLVFPRFYIIGAALTVLSVACMGSSFVVLNSFLPLLAANHPDVRAQRSSAGDGLPRASARRPGDGPASPELKMSTNISAKGIGLGYCAAVSGQCLSILLLFLVSKFGSTTTSKTLPLRLVLVLAGVIWLAFTVPAALWLRPRPGPPLPTMSSRGGTFREALEYTKFAWQSVWKTIKVAIQLRHTITFLAAWFLLSDAIATVSGTAIIFARIELRLSTVAIALLSITATASGIAGATLWPMVSRRFGWSTGKTIVACMVLMEIVPIYGLIGYIPFIQAWGVGGLQQQWEIYPLAIVYGVVMGGLSSYCRSFFGQLIPPGSEAAFYALYAITDKGSSALGPAVVGAIVDFTGHIRPAFIFLAVVILLPVPLMWRVDAEQGKRDASSMAQVLKGVIDTGDFSVDDDIELEHSESQGLMERRE